MKRLLLILLLLSGTLAANQPKSNLQIVDSAIFYASNFWETPAGKAFWATPEGKAVLKAMLDYKAKMEGTEIK